MKYIELTTTSLVSLAGRKNGLIDWTAMGTTPALINLTANKFNGAVQDKEGIYYVLPIENEAQAKKFIARILDRYGVVATIVEEASALTKIDYAKANPKSIEQAPM